MCKMPTPFFFFTIVTAKRAYFQHAISSWVASVHFARRIDLFQKVVLDILSVEGTGTKADRNFAFPNMKLVIAIVV